jgi:hypothetical protein
MTVMLLVVIVESHPFCWVCLPFDRHRISDSTLLNPYESLATIVLHVVPFARYIFLHNSLLQFPHAILLKFLVIHALICTFTICCLCPSIIGVLRSVDSRLRGLPSSSSMRWYILVAQYLCSSTG